VPWLQPDRINGLRSAGPMRRTHLARSDLNRALTKCGAGKRLTRAGKAKAHEADQGAREATKAHEVALGDHGDTARR
jgi:hypothetical protein